MPALASSTAPTAALRRRCCCRREATGQQCEIDIIGVVSKVGLQERVLAGDRREVAAHPAGGIQDGIDGIKSVVARLRLDADRASIDGRSACNIDPVTLAGRIDLNLIGAARVLHEVPADCQRAYRIAGRDRAAIQRQTCYGATAAQNTAIHSGRAGDAAVDDQATAIHREARWRGCRWQSQCHR